MSTPDHVVRAALAEVSRRRAGMLQHLATAASAAVVRAASGAESYSIEDRLAAESLGAISEMAAAALATLPREE